MDKPLKRVVFELLSFFMLSGTFVEVFLYIYYKPKSKTGSFNYYVFLFFVEIYKTVCYNYLYHNVNEMFE